MIVSIFTPDFSAVDVALRRILCPENILTFIPHKLIVFLSHLEIVSDDAGW